MYLEGFQVNVLEKDCFPRYHIEESLLASCQALLRFIGAEAKIDDFGFALKVSLFFVRIQPQMTYKSGWSRCET